MHTRPFRQPLPCGNGCRVSYAIPPASNAIMASALLLGVRMTIVIVGAGAIGLLVAGQLASSAQRVVVVARPATTLALMQGPLHISHKGQDRTTKGILAISDLAQLDHADRSPELAVLC